jgi:hypothetical protein
LGVGNVAKGNKFLDKNSIDKLDTIREFQNATFVHSIKTRDILKNNYGSPRTYKQSFLPAGKSEAKDAISRKVKHVNELDHMVQYWTSQSKSRYEGKDDNLKTQSRNQEEYSFPNDLKNFSKMVSDSNFGKNNSKLETAS